MSSEFTFNIDAMPWASTLSPILRPILSPLIERAAWQQPIFMKVDYPYGADIDDYRARRGKEEGEAQFFRDFQPVGIPIIGRGNMLMFNGAAALWQFAIALGTATANVGLATPTYLTTANANLYVGDGGPAALSGGGTASVTNNSPTMTLTNSATNVAGNFIIISGDSSSQVYKASGSGTSYTLSPVYGGSTNGTATATVITAETHTQTALQAVTNVANQVMDATFPSVPYTAAMAAISAASNLTPVVLTLTGGDAALNDIVAVTEVLGNLGANGVYVANPITGSTLYTLQGSAGTGSYTSGGLVTKRCVMTLQATFGASAAVFQWNEWGIFNGSGSNKVMMNRRVFGLGSKSSGTTSALKVGIALL